MFILLGALLIIILLLAGLLVIKSIPSVDESDNASVNTLVSVETETLSTPESQLQVEGFKIPGVGPILSKEDNTELVKKTRKPNVLKIIDSTPEADIESELPVAQEDPIPTKSSRKPRKPKLNIL